MSDLSVNIPYNMTAEEAVVASVLTRPGLFPQLNLLVADDFFILRHRYIWQAFHRLHQRGYDIDHITVIHELRNMQLLEEVGEAYITRVTLGNYSSVHVDTYAHVVKAASIRRNLLSIGDTIKQLAINEEQPVEAVMSACTDALYSVSNSLTTTHQWEFVEVADFKLRPPAEWLLPGKIPQQGLVMLFGQSGVYKSFYALETAVEATKVGHVIYVLAEGVDGMPSRVQAFEKFHNRVVENLTFSVGAVDMFNDSEMLAFRTLASRRNPVLIVVDTFAMCTGDADENSTKEMKVIVEGCRRLMMELKCAILIVHHTNKEGRVERGSKALGNACETIIRMSLEDDLIKVECLKSRDSAKFPTHYLKQVAVKIGQMNSLGEEVSSLVLLPAEIVKEEHLSEGKLQVLKLLLVEPTASLNDIAQTLEISRSAAGSMVSVLTKKGYIHRFTSTDGRQLTDKGMQEIGEESMRTDSIDSTDSTDSSSTN